MARLCILCEDQHIEKARENAKKVFGDHPVLKIPVSPSGKAPQTHWFCCANFSTEKEIEIAKIQEYSIIELEGPKSFLKKWNLRIIE